MTDPQRIKTQQREEVSLPGVTTQTVNTRRLACPSRSASFVRSRRASGEKTEPMRTQDCGSVRGETYNRIRIIMVHAPRYSFQGQARLAADAGVSRSTISRLLRGRINPSFRLAQAVTAALEKHLKRPLDPREILSPDGSYPTPSGCTLAGCRGCMPEEAYDADGCLKPDFCDLQPGDWSLARPPQSQPSKELANQKPINQGKETE